MNGLNERDRELVVIGAAIASNCIPCIELHVDGGRRAGLTDTQIRQAIAVAGKVRAHPAQLVLAAGEAALEAPLDPDAEAQPCPVLAAERAQAAARGCGC